MVHVMEKLENFIKNLNQNKLTDLELSKLLDWSYLTDPSPSRYFFYEQWIYVFVLVNLILAVICFQLVASKFFQWKPKYRLVRRIAFWWILNTILLLLYSLLRAEGVSFLSMRLFLVLILFAYIGIVAYTLAYWFLRLPKKMKKFNEARQRDRYSSMKRKR